MDVLDRRTVFVILLSIMLTSLIAVQFLRIMKRENEGADTQTPSTVPDWNLPLWKKNDFMKSQTCPAIVSQCLLPDMIDDLNNKIKHKLDLVKVYTKEIVDIETRYPITFKMNKAIIDDKYLDALSHRNYDDWVTGSLPYPQLSLAFPSSPQGLPGDVGPQGPAGLAIQQQRLQRGLPGDPGYVGVAKNDDDE